MSGLTWFPEVFVHAVPWLVVTLFVLFHAPVDSLSSSLRGLPRLLVFLSGLASAFLVICIVVVCRTHCVHRPSVGVSFSWTTGRVVSLRPVVFRSPLWLRSRHMTICPWWCSWQLISSSLSTCSDLSSSLSSPSPVECSVCATHTCQLIRPQGSTSISWGGNCHR